MTTHNNIRYTVEAERFENAKSTWSFDEQFDTLKEAQNFVDEKRNEIPENYNSLAIMKEVWNEEDEMWGNEEMIELWEYRGEEGWNERNAKR